MTRSLLLATCALLAAPQAFAQDRDNPLLPVDVTVVSLTESASRKVAQDRISTSLRVEDRGGDPASLQGRVNDKMSRALSLARRYNKVDVSTGGYSIYRISSNDEPPQWQASQSIELDSADATVLLNLAGELQKLGFLSSGMTYYLSREKAASLTDDLLEEALKKLMERAQRMGQVLGKTNVQIAEVSYGNGGYVPRPMMMKGMAMESARASFAAAPVADGSDQSVDVNINATVYLRP
ncbi:MAG: DUF541 domain-containing protein [Proteobacteria bacterium]|nr:DUF541 domain-containing protein [Pseudomonadota bacterium]